MEDGSNFGPFRLTRPLGPLMISPSRILHRWAALHERDHSSHIVYKLTGPARDRLGIRRLLTAMDTLRPLVHPHLVSIEAYSLSPQGGAAIVTPYPGDQNGLTTLSQLVQSRGGRLTPPEVARTMEHILSAAAYAHSVGHVHGPITLDRCLVDRFGKVSVELYGLERALARDAVMEEHRESYIRDELRSIAAMAHLLLTGVAPPTERDAVNLISRSVDGADPAWDPWRRRGLDDGDGFASALEALESLPRTGRAGGTRPGGVRSWWRRLKSMRKLLKERESGAV